MADGTTGRAAALPVQRGRNSIWLKLIYGLGSVAFGVKDNGFQTILLIFYNQVLGLPAAMVGLAIMIAIAVDAIMDPIIGEVSDTLRTPLGRRHPLMYASALPLGASYLLLWNPPHLSHAGLFLYLIGVSIVVRTFVSLYEAPSQALSPELTTDYAERTALLSYRSFFQWLGGLTVYALAFNVFLVRDAKHPVGQLNPVGYSHYGLAAGALMAVTILLSALGTQRRALTFTQPISQPRSLRGALADVGRSLANRSYVMLLATSFFASTATGLSLSINLYFYTYVWALSAQEIGVFAITSVAAAFAGSFLARAVAGRDKRASALILFIVGYAVASAPLTLRLFDRYLRNGDPFLFPSLLLTNFLGLAPLISAAILLASMVADVVEDSQAKTGRRSEGLFFAGATFVQKATSGVGVFLSSLILAVVHFPTHAAGANGAPAVPAEVVRHLTMIYLPTTAMLYALGFAWLSGYRITRQSHDATLRLLLEEAAEGAAVIPEA